LLFLVNITFLVGTQRVQTSAEANHAMHLILINSWHHASRDALLSIGEWRHLVIKHKN